jgi:hypothetical protein
MALMWGLLFFIAVDAKNFATILGEEQVTVPFKLSKVASSKAASNAVSANSIAHTVLISLTIARGECWHWHASSASLDFGI